MFDPSIVELVVDEFLATAVINEAVQAVRATQQRFETQVVVARSLVDSRREANPHEVRVRVLRDAPRVASLLEPHINRTLLPTLRRMAPHARRVAGVRLSVLAVEAGSSVRLDLANEPAHANDVLLVTALSGHGASGTLRILRGPLRLSGVDPRNGFVSIPLHQGRAVFAPALRPMELTDVEGTKKEPLLVVVALVQLTAR